MFENRKIKVALIGCGNIGADEKKYGGNVSPGTHAGAYVKNKKVDLVAFVDNSEAQLEYAMSNFPRVQKYLDIDKMMQEMKPDLVSIATPSGLHYEHVMKVAKYKPSVILCEKPIAYKIHEAEEMIGECKKNGVTLFINHIRHFDPLLLKWSQKVKDGVIGEVLQGNAYYYNGFYNCGTHLIDLIRMYLGDPVSVSGHYNNLTSNIKNDSNIDGQLYFKNGGMITLQSLSANYGVFGMQLYGTEGMINIKNLGYSVEYRKKVENENFAGYFQLSNDSEVEGEPRSFMKNSINSVINFMIGAESELSIGEDGLGILKILYALEESAKENEKSIQIT